jgi:hypothetical protein
LLRDDPKIFPCPGFGVLPPPHFCGIDTILPAKVVLVRIQHIRLRIEQVCTAINVAACGGGMQTSFPSGFSLLSDQSGCVGFPVRAVLGAGFQETQIRR